MKRTHIPWAEVTKNCTPTQELYAVIGGSGFVGRRLVHALILRGENRVRVIDLDENGLQELKTTYGDKIEVVVADVTNLTQMQEALSGVECVYSPFATIRFWESLRKHWNRSFKVNVEGIQNVVEAATQAGVKRLVMTSSSGAICVWPGEMPDGFDDFTPRCNEENYLNNYGLSKALQEKIVLEANGKNGMATGVIRPCSQVFGYGDKFVFGMVLNSKASPAISPLNKIDYVHVDSIVLSHLLLENRLRNGPEDEAAGETFCISQGEPVEEAVFGYLISHATAKYGEKIPVFPVPIRILCLIGTIISFIEYLHPGDTGRFLGKDLSIITIPMLFNATYVFLLRSNEKAKKILGYQPHMSLATAVESCVREHYEKKIIME